MKHSELSATIWLINLSKHMKNFISIDKIVVLRDESVNIGDLNGHLKGLIFSQ